MSGQSRECHIYRWMKGFNSSGCRQDIECLHKGTVKKVPPLTNVSSKCLLKGKIWNQASGTLRGTTLAPLLSPTSTPGTQTNRETTKRWSCSSIYPYVDVLLSFTHPEQQELSLFTAVTSVEWAQIIGMVLTPAPSHAWREVGAYCGTSLPVCPLHVSLNLQAFNSADKQCQDDQILSEILGIDHRHLSSQAVTLR